MREYRLLNIDILVIINIVPRKYDAHSLSFVTRKLCFEMLKMIYIKFLGALNKPALSPFPHFPVQTPKDLKLKLPAPLFLLIRCLKKKRANDIFFSRFPLSKIY
jgi:hypothetical protein